MEITIPLPQGNCVLILLSSFFHMLALVFHQPLFVISNPSDPFHPPIISSDLYGYVKFVRRVSIVINKVIFPNYGAKELIFHRITPIIELKWYSQG